MRPVKVKNCAYKDILQKVKNLQFTNSTMVTIYPEVVFNWQEREGSVIALTTTMTVIHCRLPIIMDHRIRIQDFTFGEGGYL